MSSNSAGNHLGVIVDTNFLLIPAQFKLDVFSEISRIVNTAHSVYILDRTREELEHIIESQKGKNRLAAKLALQLVLIHLKTKDLKILPSPQEHIRPKTAEKAVDDLIVEIAAADPGKWIVATQDLELKKRLRKHGVKLIVLRQKSHLELN